MIKYAVYFELKEEVRRNIKKEEMKSGFVKTFSIDTNEITYCKSKMEAFSFDTEEECRKMLVSVRKIEGTTKKFMPFRFELN